MSSAMQMRPREWRTADPPHGFELTPPRFPESIRIILYGRRTCGTRRNAPGRAT